jgi:hypothetical protein
VSGVRRVLRRGVARSDRSERFEDWLSVVVTQLVDCRHLLYTREGLLFGFRIGWHVYTTDGFYVGSFRDTLDRDDAAELYSASGNYLGERDPDDADRLAVDVSKRNLRKSRVPELPPLPAAAITLYSVREPILSRDGWQDFPPPDTFAFPQRELPNAARRTPRLY